MRASLDRRIEAMRVAGDPGSGCTGAFLLRGAPSGILLYCVVSDGRDWQTLGLPAPAWEHVSVSVRAGRCPGCADLQARFAEAVTRFVAGRLAQRIAQKALALRGAP